MQVHRPADYSSRRDLRPYSRWRAGSYEGDPQRRVCEAAVMLAGEGCSLPTAHAGNFRKGGAVIAEPSPRRRTRRRIMALEESRRRSDRMGEAYPYPSAEGRLDSRYPELSDLHGGLIQDASKSYLVIVVMLSGYGLGPTGPTPTCRERDERDPPRSNPRSSRTFTMDSCRLTRLEPAMSEPARRPKRRAPYMSGKQQQVGQGP